MRRPQTGPVLACLLTLATVPVLAQWQGTGRAQGVVLDPKGKPMQDARVTLAPEATPDQGPPAATTDKKGRWAFLGLAGGRWRLTIEAEGYITSEGWIMVPDEGPAPLTRVEMRPLEEVSPSFAEGNPAPTVAEWLEKGNVLLEQGRYAEAREEYRKALNQLPPERHPEVLRSIARTYYLERERDKAVEALKHGLYDVPDDEPTRQLLTALMEGMGRGEEVREWLARLDREGPDFIAEELGFDETGAAVAGEGDQRPPRLPLERPLSHRVGRYKTSFTDSSPLSGVQVFTQRYGLEPAEIDAVDPTGGRYDLAEESFEVFVPESYRAERPAGLFVWVSPTPYGGLTRQELMDVLAEKGLIWIGANRSGNGRPKWTRMGLALDAVHNMKRLYNVDPDRVYVAGYSGGGRVASGLAMVYPEVFQGAFCVYGVDFYRRVSRTDMPGAHWLPGFPEPPRSRAKEVKTEHRYVLLTGELDFNRTQTKAYYRELLDDGFEHVLYLEIPGADHYTGVAGEWLARAIDALDAPLGRRSGAAG